MNHLVKIITRLFWAAFFALISFNFAEKIDAQTKPAKNAPQARLSITEKNEGQVSKFLGLPKEKDSSPAAADKIDLPSPDFENDEFPTTEDLEEDNGLPSPLSEEPKSESAAPKKSKTQTENGLWTMGKLLSGPAAWTSSEGILSSSKIVILLTILSIAPAILMMTTSYVRIITVLSILRQGLGTGQIPSTQVLAAISLFLSLLIMWPTWNEVYEKGILPYANQEIDERAALEAGSAPIRTFLWKQIEKTGNTEAIWLFMRYIPDAEKPEYYEDIPWRALLPAFILSELKTAFLIGFQLLLPFLIVDLVVSGIMVSMGMMMIPPTIVALPFKLMLFVLLDGWTLLVKMLLDSFMITG